MFTFIIILFLLLRAIFVVDLLFIIVGMLTFSGILFAIIAVSRSAAGCCVLFVVEITSFTNF